MIDYARRLLLVLLVLTSQSCALLSDLFQKPNVTLRRVDLTSLSFSGISANFVLNVDNPNAIGIDLARLAYQLTIEGKQLAAGQANQAVSVPANGTGTAVLPVGIKFSDFVSSIEALFTKDKINYNIALAPGFNTPVGVMDIPLSYAGTFPVPKLPDVSLGSPSVGGMDLSGATLSLPMNIRNKNGFALPIQGLSYTVTLAGSPLLQAGAFPGDVPANQQQSVPITARIDFLKAGLGVMNAVRGGAADVSLSGALDLGGYQMPLNLATRLGN